MSPRPTAIASCVFCAWRIRHTDDTAEDVAAFLRARLIQHTRDRHCVAELRAALHHVAPALIPAWRDILDAAGPCTHDRACEGEPRPAS